MSRTVAAYMKPRPKSMSNGLQPLISKPLSVPLSVEPRLGCYAHEGLLRLPAPCSCTVNTYESHTYPLAMDNFNPADIPLPQIIDPILSYLSSVLPPPVYSILLTVCSHTLALVTSFVSLSWTLIQSRPWEWEAHTLIPLVISILTAYLALSSAWRTASWMLRTSFWFVKWGTIIAALVGGLGWITGGAAGGGAGVGQPAGGMGVGGMVTFLSGLAMDAMNGQDQNAAGGPRTRARTRPNTNDKSGSRDTRPKAGQKDWQYQENANNGGAGAGELNEVLQGIIGSVMGDGGWLDVAKNAWNGLQNAGAVDEEESNTGRRKQPPRQGKSKAQARSR
ncbi:hypothetical protein FIBSPDRAFT_4159 [Athelia psychrophila]|uniref:Uncharacterized protein n=1 Tax=Athelia psychrophila TaxID=1759441 RepID=A0A166X0J3_9AGAM|nr:hypothetical protein FIBSPDRAFT_4159 [Fibularhizoctonia sp. CBS 109695]